MSRPDANPRLTNHFSPAHIPSKLQRMRSQHASLALLTLKRAQSLPRQPTSHPPSALFSTTRKTPKYNPLNEYPSDALNAPLNPIQATTSTVPPPPTPPPLERPKTGPEEAAFKAQQLFGSRSTDPAAREAELKKASTTIAGVLVPPRPDEPDNCCMSGCVNCVWDRYRDELEDWAAASAEARAKLKAQSASQAPGHVMNSMDDDGGGSETNWEVEEGGVEVDLFEGVPVGIRVYED